MATSSSTNGYRQAAQQWFGSLMKSNAPSFWRLGYSFDTMIDYLDNVEDSSAPGVGDRVLTQYEILLNNLNGYSGAWFDDLGWWTIALQRAGSKSFFKPESKSQFVFLLSECWKQFTGNAPYVWRRATDTFNDYRPAVDGGVWNEYWKGTSSTYLGPNDGDPSSGSLHGIQNTVTNAVYLITAQRLGLTDSEARAESEREYNFLSAWLWSQQPPLWWTQSSPVITSPAALVRERVSHFFKNGNNLAPGFQTNWAWTGDQGLILGALTDRMGLDPQNYQGLLERTKQLLTGVWYSLADQGKGLTNWTNTGNVPDGDSDDYNTGVGVFWRNVLYAWKNNPDLRAFLNDPMYQQFLKFNADAAVPGPDPSADFNTLTNGLAVLVAATVMLP